MKVVSFWKLSLRGICKNPQLASSLLNTVAPAIQARVLSTVGNMDKLDVTHSQLGHGDTLICTWPDFFGATSMPEHHGVGSSTGEMTPARGFHPRYFVPNLVPQ